MIDELSPNQFRVVVENDMDRVRPLLWNSLRKEIEMSIIRFKPVKGSARFAHQQVEIDEKIVGEVWREQSRVIVSKLSQPLRQEIRWRWFGKGEGDTKTLGRDRQGLVGLGFTSKDKVVEALVTAVVSNAN
ncbi:MULTISPECIES: hypothetical protein [unclassified Janthinobacterium]|uniref:hypothetical protein n=1 Tax=unclassified Janthinobacterium TaxID=2610881 RepID=UPI0011133C98|nr:MULTISPECIES: hypothetical protein [unclassified Janthinobacterium]